MANLYCPRRALGAKCKPFLFNTVNVSLLLELLHHCFGSHIDMGPISCLNTQKWLPFHIHLPYKADEMNVYVSIIFHQAMAIEMSGFEPKESPLV